MVTSGYGEADVYAGPSLQAESSGPMCAFVTDVAREWDAWNTLRPGEARAEPGPDGTARELPRQKGAAGAEGGEGNCPGFGAHRDFAAESGSRWNRDVHICQQQAQEPLGPGPLTEPPRARWANGQPGRLRSLQ